MLKENEKAIELLHRLIELLEKGEVTSMTVQLDARGVPLVMENGIVYTNNISSRRITIEYTKEETI